MCLTFISTKIITNDRIYLSKSQWSHLDAHFIACMIDTYVVNEFSQKFNELPSFTPMIDLERFNGKNGFLLSYD